jgi:hypothetical protein
MEIGHVDLLLLLWLFHFSENLLKNQSITQNQVHITMTMDGMLQTDTQAILDSISHAHKMTPVEGKILLNPDLQKDLLKVHMDIAWKMD